MSAFDPRRTLLMLFCLFRNANLSHMTCESCDTTSMRRHKFIGLAGKTAGQANQVIEEGASQSLVGAPFNGGSDGAVVTLGLVSDCECAAMWAHAGSERYPAADG